MGIKLKQTNGNIELKNPGSIIIQGGGGECNCIYIGTEAPQEEDVKVWINPDGDILSDLATKEYVDAAVAGVEAPEVDLSDYALKSDIPSLDGYAKAEDIPDVSGYATKAEVEAAGYATAADVIELIDSALGEVENGSY